LLEVGAESVKRAAMSAGAQALYHESRRQLEIIDSCDDGCGEG
jgi:hypothetical protein